MQPLNLKELERRAFKSYYKDGLWDLYLGFLIMIMPLSGFLAGMGAPKTVSILSHLLLTFGACMIFILVKKNVTAPRLGHVDFSPARKAKTIHLKYVLGITAAFGATLFGLAILSHQYQITSMIELFSNRTLIGIGSGAFFLITFSVMAFLMDFTRAYAMGIVFGAGIASAMIVDTPVFMIISGCLFVILGCVYFIRFLKANPLITTDRDL